MDKIKELSESIGYQKALKDVLEGASQLVLDKKFSASEVISLIKKLHDELE